MRKPGITLTLHLGEYGERSYEVSLQLSERTVRELMEPMELSNDPFSLMLDGLHGAGSAIEAIGATVTRRKRNFAMRREVADDISRALIDALNQQFGRNDKLDGYSVEGMSEEERAWHRSRGRL